MNLVSKKITLRHGQIATVDDEDFESLSRLEWHAQVDPRTTYARTDIVVSGRKTTRAMHRIILGVEDPLIQVDHINHDGLDNRKANLRLCTAQQNRCNRRVHKNNKLGVKGVCFFHNRYKADISINGRTKYIGMFDSIEDAASAYDAEAIRHYGEFAKTNRAIRRDENS